MPIKGSKQQSTANTDWMCWSNKNSDRLLFWCMLDERAMISALLRYSQRRLCKSTPPPPWYIQWHQILWFNSSGSFLVQELLPLPLLAGLEGELHQVSVGHLSMAAEMEQPLQGSVSLGIEEEPRIGNGSTVEPASDLVKSESDRIKTLYQTALSAIMVFVTAALSSYKDMKPLYSTSTTSHSKARLSNLLVDEGLFIFMTFLCAVVLMMSEFVVYQYARRCHVWCWVLTILVTVTGAMLIVADTILLIVTNRNNMALSVFLAPVVLLVGVAAGGGAWMQEEEEPSSELAPYDAAMKRTFDTATFGTIVSFTLQGGIVFGYLKTPGSNEAKRDPPLDLAACYATSMLSLTGMMVCAMPLAYLPGDMLKVLVRVAERLRSALLAALAMMALVVSVEFLDGFVVLSFFPDAVAIVLYYAVKLFSACQPPEERSTLDFTFRIVATAGFTLMTGLYAAFLGTDHYNFYLKTAMFTLLLAVLSSLCRLAIPLHMPAAGAGGIIELGIAGVALAFPLVALLAAIPLVFKVFVDHYVNR